MPVTEQLQDALDQLNEHGSFALDALLGFCLLWGVFLWLAGTRVVRANFAMQGLILGAIGAGLIARSQGAQPIAAYIAVGGIAGAAVVYLTYRLWIAMALAITLAIVTPLAVIAYHGNTPPNPADSLNEIKNELQAGVDDSAQGLRDLLPDLSEIDPDVLPDGLLPPDLLPEGVPDLRPGRDGDDADPADADADNRDAEPTGDTLVDRVYAVVRSFAGAIVDWWKDDLTNAVRGTIIVGTLAAAATGIMIGLIMPNLAAAIVTAVIGASLLLLGVTLLGQRHAESLAQHLPNSLRANMALILGAALIGTIIQWTIVRPKADD